MDNLPSEKIKAIFFDLDGVLVDAADWHRDAFNQALMDFNELPLTQDEHINVYNGLSTYKKLEILMKDRHGAEWSGADKSAFYDCKQVLTKKIISKNCMPVQRIIDTVAYAASKYKTAVVTNCSRQTALMMLELSGLTSYFDFIITNEDVDGKVKPHPRPYIMANEHFGLKSKEALAIDDTFKGIKSAREAFCRTWRLKKFADLTVANLQAVLLAYRYPL